MPILAPIVIPDSELEYSAIRAQGPGGQNVNKVSCAVHLRFNIASSSLPEVYKERLLALRDQRITKDGVVVIKAQQSRSLEKNKAQALQRLLDLVGSVARLPKIRKATRPTRNSQTRRLDRKATHGQTKAMRGKVTD